MSRALNIAVVVGSVAAVLAYPLIVYFGLGRFSVRALGVILVVMLLPGQLLRLKGAKRAHLKAVLPLPVALALVLVLAALVEDHRLILVLPVVINGTLLVGFVASLRAMPLVERFARMQVDDLSPPEVAYCRKVTILWSLFFACNGAAALLLALRAPISWWTVYNGGVAYVGMGALFAGEYIYRKARFRRFGAGWHDHVLARFFPPEQRRDCREIAGTAEPANGGTLPRNATE